MWSLAPGPVADEIIWLKNRQHDRRCSTRERTYPASLTFVVAFHLLELFETHPLVYRCVGLIFAALKIALDTLLVSLVRHDAEELAANALSLGIW